ncbi:MAG: protein kinase [Thermoanaerobaculia bacterium]|nr:protein kinase [Thermoanaerobaculia bacterium]
MVEGTNQRYRIEGFLGAGGTGQVYRAWDSMLDRAVAFKVLRSVDEAALEKALLEARAQAQVTHPNICPVFDAGLQDGKAFIASQLIEGPTLSDAPEFPTRQAVGLVRDIARAVEKAHQQNLVHRDLKPQNVLLDGGTPLVVDFGIASHARQTDAAHSTETSSGTPAYMAPEQIRGGPDALERPVDIYALGGLLHELLTGSPPFEAADEIQLLKRVLSEDPPRIEEINPTISPDLGAIAFRCLEKVPARRYASAGDFADELDRWLAGYPVKAFAGGSRYRSSLWLRRHRTMVAVAAVVLMAGAIGATLATREVARNKAQARMARDFGIEAEQIGTQLQLAHLSPTNDLQSVREQVGRRMEDLVRRVDSLGSLAVGPGENALGYAALRLGDLEEATTHFEASWNSGYQRPEVALGLAEAMARRYAEAQRTLWYLSSTVRAVRKEQLSQELLQPAIEKLRFGLGSGRSASLQNDRYLSTLEAFLEDRFDEVPTLASQGLEAEPFRYENLLLVGYSARSQAIVSDLDGDPDQARLHLQKARDAFAAAAAIARSDPKVFQEVCQADEALVYDALRQSIEDPGQPSPACNRAIELDPEDAGPHLARAGLYQRLAIGRARRGTDPSGALAEAQGHLEQALDQEPNNAGAHFLMATHRMIQADTTGWHKEGDRAQFAALALSHAQRGVDLEPSSVWAPFLLGQAYYRAATAAVDQGEDPSEHVRAAEEHFERAIQLAPQVGRTYSSYGSLLDWFSVVQAETLGQDPRPYKEKAKGVLRQAAALEPRNVIPVNLLAAASLTMADYLWRFGQDPSPEIEEGDGLLEKSLELRPDSVTALSNRSELWLTKIESDLATLSTSSDSEESILASLEDAFTRHRHAHDRAYSLDPDEFGCSLAKSDWYRARIDRRRGADPAPVIHRGLRQTKQMLSRFPDSWYCQRDHARLLLEKARLDAGSSARVEDSASWNEGIELINSILEDHQTSYELWDLRGAYYLLAADESSPPSRQTQAALAVASFQRGLELYPGRINIEEQLSESQAIESSPVAP